MGKKTKQIHEYESRLEIFEGKMGAGKSYFAVRRMFNVMHEQSRPVYTNLPIKWRVVRKYLRDRHGDEVANLVNELTEPHWREFLRRQHAFSLFKAEWERRDPRLMSGLEIQSIFDACQLYYPENPPSFHKLQHQDHLYINQIISLFNVIHSEPITSGEYANHIPPSAIIIIDEVQKWHPMINQSKDKDREHLLSYITMSRHHAHWIWVLTQDAMNISIEFRRLSHHIWSIWNRFEDQLAGPLRYKHLGLRPLGYAKQTPEEYDQQKSRVGENKKNQALEFFTIFTNLPGSKLFFRFYSSETHLGSRRQLLKQLQEGRVRAGLSADGVNMKPDQEEEKTMSIFSKLYLLVALVMSLVAGYFVGYQAADPIESETQIVEQVESWPEWSMLSKTPWIGGQPVQVGQNIEGTNAKLIHITDDNRSLVFDVDGYFWLWEFGNEPLRVGAKDDIRIAVAAVRDAQRTEPGSSLPID